MGKQWAKQKILIGNERNKFGGFQITQLVQKYFIW
jgi:hypothetical protein